MIFTNELQNRSSLGSEIGKGITGRGSPMYKKSHKHKIAGCSQGKQLIQYGRECERDWREQGRLENRKGLMTKGRSLP